MKAREQSKGPSRGRSHRIARFMLVHAGEDKPFFERWTAVPAQARGTLCSKGLKTFPPSRTLPSMDKNESLALYDVLGIGNAIVDMLAQVDDSLIQELELHKGTMALIDAEQAERLTARLGGRALIRSGGSAANTIAGISSFGGRGAFIGRVANDPLGEEF